MGAYSLPHTTLFVLFSLFISVLPVFSWVPSSGTSGRSIENKLNFDALATDDGRRRALLLVVANSALLSISPPLALSAVDPGPSSDPLSLLGTARSELNKVPDLIASGKWDAVRATLITPPVNDLWSKSSPLSLRAAAAIGELPNGDELAALEAREDLTSHLQYLDMAVYNNNFNPITVEGENGASKELIRSYYEDPMNEYKASIAALDSILKLAGGAVRE